MPEGCRSSTFFPPSSRHGRRLEFFSHDIGTNLEVLPGGELGDEVEEVGDDPEDLVVGVLLPLELGGDRQELGAPGEVAGEELHGGQDVLSLDLGLKGIEEIILKIFKRQY